MHETYGLPVSENHGINWTEPPSYTPNGERTVCVTARGTYRGCEMVWSYAHLKMSEAGEWEPIDHYNREVKRAQWTDYNKMAAPPSYAKALRDEVCTALAREWRAHRNRWAAAEEQNIALKYGDLVRTRDELRAQWEAAAKAVQDFGPQYVEMVRAPLRNA